MKLGKYFLGIVLSICGIKAYFCIPNKIRVYTDIIGSLFISSVFSTLSVYLSISTLNDLGLLKVKLLSDNQTKEIKKITHNMAVEMKSDIIQEVLQELKTKNADVVG
ncbi:MAG: hypothetical protein ATN34_04280 [Epulopiscium sp. Nele67-Bin002]|nr:MAG: hypothetical protein ATN34_04280 [Epulopiscium sp. Nele67-Bin002]OON91893.1 MAG: hypothetical protein ATN33_08380 [Epulopiscium sp. Nele67-Bin001]